MDLAFKIKDYDKLLAAIDKLVEINTILNSLDLSLVPVESSDEVPEETPDQNEQMGDCS